MYCPNIFDIVLIFSFLLYLTILIYYNLTLGTVFTYLDLNPIWFPRKPEVYMERNVISGLQLTYVFWSGFSSN